MEGLLGLKHRCGRSVEENNIVFLMAVEPRFLVSRVSGLATIPTELPRSIGQEEILKTFL